MLQCFFSLFLCFCFSDRTSCVEGRGFPRRGGGGGEEEGRWLSEFLERCFWRRGGEAEWLGLEAGLSPGLAARLPLRLLSALAAALARSAARESWHSRPPFHSCTITCRKRNRKIQNFCQKEMQIQSKYISNLSIVAGYPSSSLKVTQI